MLYMTRRMTTNCSQSASQVLTNYYHDYNYTDLTQSGITSRVTHDLTSYAVMTRRMTTNCSQSASQVLTNLP